MPNTVPVPAASPAPKPSHYRDDPRLSGEGEVVWLVPPESLPYVRESVVTWCARRQGPLKWDTFKVVGWTNLRSDAPNSGSPGRFVRRVFWLKDYDPYEGGTSVPAEAVDPLTVAPGVPGWLTPRCTPGRKRQPSPSSNTEVENQT